MMKSGGGLLVVCEMSNPELYREICDDFAGMKVYTRGEIVSAMERCGFSKVNSAEKEEWLTVAGRLKL